MNLFEGMFLNTILLLLPLTLYLLYLVYAKTINREDTFLWLKLALLTSFYFIYKYGDNLMPLAPIFFLALPLILSYTKKCLSCTVLFSFLLIVYHYHYDFNIYLLFLEYGLYFILYLTIKKCMLFINLFLIIKIIFLILWYYYSSNYLALDTIVITKSIIILITYYAFLQLMVYLFYKGEKIVNLHNILEELEYEKQLKSSLFKITHEIKNPIAVCKGYLDMMDINNTDHIRRYIPIIKEEIEQTLVIIKDFLKIGHVVIEKDIMDIVMLIEEVINSYEVILEKNNIKYKIDMKYEELYIEADYNRLKQVLLNVIKNSTEAIGKDGNINIKVTNDKDKVYIEIKDDGCGMSKEELDRLKKPFFTTKKNGIGLGVSLSDEIIKAHDGEMQYISEKGKGTTVTIKLKKS